MAISKAAELIKEALQELTPTCKNCKMCSGVINRETGRIMLLDDEKTPVRVCRDIKGSEVAIFVTADDTCPNFIQK